MKNSVNCQQHNVCKPVMEPAKRTSSRNIKKNAHINKILQKEESRAKQRKVSAILKKKEAEWSCEERKIILDSPEVAKTQGKRLKSRKLAQDRLLEVEDSPENLIKKCRSLAAAIKKSEHFIVYTGAGISTAASIPDYRGPNGVWTLLSQGRKLKWQDLSEAEPTFTHMSLMRLYEEEYLKYVVSQNCDGLHLRSGLPRDILSEVHGNMFIETCHLCKKEVIRLFDVTEKTGLRRHKTGRICPNCNNYLYDTIVHFGEKGDPCAPHNWPEARDAAEVTDLILCLGSSLKILKKYSCLWNQRSATSEKADLYIVNLQWTPKDDIATLKINGKCDEVMSILMKELAISVNSYKRELDPIFVLATPLLSKEKNTTTRRTLAINEPAMNWNTDLELRMGGGNGQEIKKQEQEPLTSTCDCGAETCTLCSYDSSETESIDSCDHLVDVGEVNMKDILPDSLNLTSEEVEAVAEEPSESEEEQKNGWYGKGLIVKRLRKKKLK